MNAAQERATKLAAAKSAEELAQRLVEMADDSDNYTDDADLRAAADLLRAAHDVAAVKHAVWVHLAAVFSARPDGRGDRTFYSTDTGSSLTSGELAERIARDVCALSSVTETRAAAGGAS